MKRPSINIAPVERAGRVVLGLLAAVTGGVLLVAGGSVVAVAFEVVLVLAGLDLVITGALGHCPLYARLGHVPKALRRST